MLELLCLLTLSLCRSLSSLCLGEVVRIVCEFHYGIIGALRENNFFVATFCLALFEGETSLAMSLSYDGSF